MFFSKTYMKLEIYNQVTKNNVNKAVKSTETFIWNWFTINKMPIDSVPWQWIAQLLLFSNNFWTYALRLIITINSETDYHLNIIYFSCYEGK